MRPRTITVNGFSKSYAMTGWRLGYVGVDRSLMSALVRAHQYSTNCVSTFSQYGATEALNGPQAALDGERGVEEEVLRLGFNLEHHQVLHGDQLTLLAGPLADGSNLLEGPEAHRRGADALRR